MVWGSWLDCHYPRFEPWVSQLFLEKISADVGQGAARLQPAGALARPDAANVYSARAKARPVRSRPRLGRCMAWGAAAGRSSRGSATVWHSLLGLDWARSQLTSGKTEYKNIGCKGKTQIFFLFSYISLFFPKFFNYWSQWSKWPYNQAHLWWPTDWMLCEVLEFLDQVCLLV